MDNYEYWVACSSPPVLQIEPTTHCNMNCPFCLRNKFIPGEGGSISPEIFKKAVSYNGFRYPSLHWWGEPLMNPNLFEMIKYGAKKGLSVNFTTNATLIHEIAGDLLSSDLDIVAFSIPDLSLFFQKIYNNIEYFHKCREKRGLTHPKTYMNVAMMGCNFDTVEETLSVSRRLGVDAVNFERSYLWRPEFSGKEDEVFRRADDFAAKTGLKIYLPVCHTLPCRLFNTTLFVRYNGDVTPCCYRPDKVLRNIASDSMDDIMSRRGTFRENMEKDPVCMACGI